MNGKTEKGHGKKTYLHFLSSEPEKVRSSGEKFSQRKFQTHWRHRHSFLLSVNLSVDYGLTARAVNKCTGWPKKVSHYRESSLNRIKNRQPG